MTLFVATPVEWLMVKDGQASNTEFIMCVCWLLAQLSLQMTYYSFSWFCLNFLSASVASLSTSAALTSVALSSSSSAPSDSFETLEYGSMDCW